MDQETSKMINANIINCRIDHDIVAIMKNQYIDPSFGENDKPPKPLKSNNQTNSKHLTSKLQNNSQILGRISNKKKYKLVFTPKEKDLRR